MSGDLATGLMVQSAHSIHIRYENTTFPYQESRRGPLCVSQRLGGITGGSELDSSQDEPANTCSCMWAQGDDYVIVRSHGGDHELMTQDTSTKEHTGQKG